MRNARFAGTLQSPLTDSNRRPPPYHAGHRNPRQRFCLISAVFGVALFATRCHRLRPLCSINAPSRVVGAGYAEGAMLSRPAAVSLASRRLRKWGREGNAARPLRAPVLCLCKKLVDAAADPEMRLRPLSRPDRLRHFGCRPRRNPRERRTRGLRIGGSIEIRSRTPPGSRRAPRRYAAAARGSLHSLAPAGKITTGSPQRAKAV